MTVKSKKRNYVGYSEFSYNSQLNYVFHLRKNKNLKGTGKIKVVNPTSSLLLRVMPWFYLTHHMYIHGKLINIPFQKVSKNNTIALYSQEYYNKY